MTDRLKERFRALDALDFPHGAGPPDMRSPHTTGESTRARSIVTAIFALVIGATALGFAIRAFERAPDRPPRPVNTGDELPTGPGTCDHGPWIELCPEAEWARSVVAAAGLQVVDEQAVLVLGTSEGGESYFWAMDPSHHGQVTPFSEIVAEGTARVVDHVDGVSVYGFPSNERLWLWRGHGLQVWLDGRAPLTEPSRQDIVALVRASHSVPYTSATPAPDVTIPDIVGLRDQPAMRSLYELGLNTNAIVRYRETAGADPWRVVTIFPAPGTRVARGAVVEVVVATRVTPLPRAATNVLDCDPRHREAFGGPYVRIDPGGSAYITGNIGGIELTDEVTQATFQKSDPWTGLWHVIRGGSVIAVVDFPLLDGVACQGSGVGGA
jgi:hypothetical protein